MSKIKTPIVDAENYWPYQVAVLADLVTRHVQSIVKSRGTLNQSQWRVLAAIAENSGCTSADVVCLTPMDKGIVSRAVGSLIEEGMVVRTPDPGDKRRATLAVTKAGKDHYKDISRRVVDSLATASPESVLLAQTLRAPIAALKDKQSR